jgi:uncharacterized RDD family membrane protein YckC
MLRADVPAVTPPREGNSVTVQAASSALAPASIGARVVAYIIDAIILGIVGGILNALLRSEPRTAGAINVLLGLVYFVYFWSASGQGQTLGMRVLNLKVIKTDGSMLTYTQAVIRYLGLFLSFLVVLIGVIWVAFDPEKQGWHDKIAGTYVVKT